MLKAAFAAIQRDDKYLLVQSLTSPKYINSWSFPGGLAFKKEDLQTTAIRECIEETNIHCHNLQLICRVNNLSDNVMVYIYHADYLNGRIGLNDGEIADARWMTIQQALTMPLAYNTEEILSILNQISR